MQISTNLHSADELQAASVFMQALADLRRKLETKFKDGEYKLPDTLDTPIPADPYATTAPIRQEDMDAIREEAAQAKAIFEQGAKDGDAAVAKKTRRKKADSPAPSTEMVVSEPEQLDIEEILHNVVMAADDKPEPSDPTAGWTIDDARQAARTMLGRAPTSEAGNKALADLLDSYGVTRIGELASDAYESFVTGTMRENF